MKNKSKAQYFSILIFIIFAFVISGVFLFSDDKVIINSLAALSLVEKPIVAPTEIDQNFLDQVNKCFIPTAALYGYTLRVTSDFRSQTEQDELFNQGRTVNGHIVSWAEPGKSLHNYGFAVDVVDRWRGYNIDWGKLKKIGEFCSLEQVDGPHFENRAGLATSDFALGLRPPLLKLPCAVMHTQTQANKPLTLEDLKNCNAPKF